MSRFVVELSVGCCATIYVDAKDAGEAVEKAKEKVNNAPTNYCDDVGIEGVNFIQEV